MARGLLRYSVPRKRGYSRWHENCLSIMGVILHLFGALFVGINTKVLLQAGFNSYGMALPMRNKIENPNC